MTPNLPNDFINRMRSQLGDEFNDFILSYENPCAKSLRVNTLKCSAERYLDIVADNAKSYPDIVSWEKSGIYYRESEEPGKSPLHAAGAYYIQEASAMFPVTLMDITADVDRIGLKILDLCAAPGGKSTQIASYMKGRGLLVSNEIIPTRAKILSENIERMGVRNALVISEEPGKLADRFPGFFDRILVDAPCSGEGMFRKHPEAALEWSPENVEMCADRQDMILDCAAKMLAPGGKIVYSTCTFSEAEDEGTTDRFILSHPEFEICDAPIRLFPHKVRGEGHFAVSFVRTAEKKVGLSAPEKRSKAKGGAAKTLSSAESELLRDFVATTYAEDSFLRLMIENAMNNGSTAGAAAEAKGVLLRFGDSLYLCPESVPDLSGLKVLRAGLKIGEFRKNRFEPDHALALASKKEEMRCCCDFDSKSAEIKGYLTGMTLTPVPENGKTVDDFKGWCLVCTDGISLGWGKSAGGVIKNHYPKGLRV